MNPFPGLILAATLAAPALAQEHQAYRVEGGTLALNLLESNLADAGLEVELLPTLEVDPVAVQMEDVDVAFEIDPTSDLRFLVDQDGNFVPYGILGGTLRMVGGFRISSPSTGRSVDFTNFDIRAAEVFNDGPGGEPDPDYFFLTQPGDTTGDDLRLCYVKVMYGPVGYTPGDHGDPNALRIKAWDLFVNESLAQELGRPDVEDLLIGVGHAQLSAAVSERPYTWPRGQNPGTPYQGGYTGPSDGGGVDVSLGILNGITQMGRIGSFPNGKAGLSMSTTSCNLGSVNVPWLSPMAEDHPGILMALYREKDGTFQQVGTSWVKHGFFALSNSQCIPCLNPSNGTFLGIGCSDTYGSFNNGDRFYLGPRDEWDAFEATWDCEGSFFDGTPIDCERDENGNGLGPVAHRLEVVDADLDNPGATYYYEAMYLVRDDVNKVNNIGSRRCEMFWTGFSWLFSTPSASAGNPLVEGPAILRWSDADLTTTVGNGDDDGEAILAVNTIDQGDGTWRYEYSLFNWTMDRNLGSLSLPVCGDVSELRFHDGDEFPENDWQPVVEGGHLTWTFPDVVIDTDDKVAGALEVQYLYSFGFTSSTPPAGRSAVLGVYEDGDGADVLAAETLAPGCLNLAADVVGPEPGDTIEVCLTDGSDHGLFAIVDIEGVPLGGAVLFPAAAVPFVGGEVSVPLAIPASAAGLEVGLLAGDVGVAPLSLIEVSNSLRIVVQ